MSLWGGELMYVCERVSKQIWDYEGVGKYVSMCLSAWSREWICEWMNYHVWVCVMSGWVNARQREYDITKETRQPKTERITERTQHWKENKQRRKREKRRKEKESTKKDWDWKIDEDNSFKRN